MSSNSIDMKMFNASSSEIHNDLLHLKYAKVNHIEIESLKEHIRNIISFQN